MFMDSSIAWIFSIFAGNTLCYPLDNIKSRAQCNFNTHIKLSHLFYGYKYFIINILIARFLTFTSYVTLTEHIHPFPTVFLISLVSSMISTPLEMLKINKQIETNNKYKFSELHKLYKGYNYAFYRDFTSTGFYFPLYFYLKNNYDNPTYINGFIAGCMSKIVSYPFDTIKTIKQSGLFVKHNKFFYLFNGITYETLRTGTSSLIIFSTYEHIMSKLK